MISEIDGPFPRMRIALPRGFSPVPGMISPRAIIPSSHAGRTGAAVTRLSLATGRPCSVITTSSPALTFRRYSLSRSLISRTPASTMATFYLNAATAPAAGGSVPAGTVCGEDDQHAGWHLPRLETQAELVGKAENNEGPEAASLPAGRAPLARGGPLK